MVITAPAFARPAFRRPAFKRPLLARLSAAAAAIAAVVCLAPAVQAQIEAEPVAYEIDGESFEGYVARNPDLAGDLPVVAVGGAAFLVPDTLRGASDVIRVANAECANAVGAALAQVAGEVDHIYKDASRAEALEDAQRRACERAVNAGANAATLELTDVEEIPLAYLPGNSVRVRARVIGSMATAGSDGQPTGTSAGNTV